MSDDLKDESEVEKPSQETIIESWLEKFGQEKQTKAGLPYWHLDAKDYKEAFSSLLNSLLYAGYTETDVRSSSLLTKIHDAVTADVTSSSKLNNWKDMVNRTWKFVLAKQFANKDLIKPATNFAAEEPVKEKVEAADDDGPPPKPYVSPKTKLDPNKFEGYGDAEVIYDEDFAKLFEAIKDE